MTILPWQFFSFENLLWIFVATKACESKEHITAKGNWFIYKIISTEICTRFHLPNEIAGSARPTKTFHMHILFTLFAFKKIICSDPIVAITTVHIHSQSKRNQFNSKILLKSKTLMWYLNIWPILYRCVLSIDSPRCARIWHFKWRFCDLGKRKHRVFIQLPFLSIFETENGKKILLWILR